MKKTAVILAELVLIASLFGCSGNPETDSNVNVSADENLMTESDTPLTPDTVNGLSDVKMSDDLYDFTLEISGKVYRLPMSVSDFAADGWSSVSDNMEEKELDPQSCLSRGVEMTNDHGENIRIVTANYSDKKMKIADCTLTGFIYPEENEAAKLPDVKLAKGIEVRAAKSDELKAAYGEPTVKQINGHYSSSLCYEKEDNKSSRYMFNFDENDVLVTFTVSVNEEGVSLNPADMGGYYIK